MIVRTSYGTGPYVITKVSGPYTDPSFVASLNGDNTPSKPHYCFVCKDVGNPRSHESYLNGYDENCNNVWRSDRLIVCSEETTMLALVASL